MAFYSRKPKKQKGRPGPYPMRQGMALSTPVTPSSGSGVDRTTSWMPSKGSAASSRTVVPGSNLAMDERHRFEVEPRWPQGGNITAEIGDRNYDVQAFTGYPTSTVGAGQWQRGQLVRTNTPTGFCPSTLGMTMYDPTDSTTYNQTQQNG